MNFSAFEFAQGQWLWALLVPLFIIWLTRRYVPRYLRIRDFADAHLLPHLLINGEDKSLTQKRAGHWVWIVMWCLGVLALAGPRWDYEEQEVLKPRVNLMLLLDLSESMRVKDLPHARLEQAKQEIEEIVGKDREMDIGLMVFAGLPHLVTPLSDDYQNLKSFLNNLFIDDMKQYSVQGTRLAVALEEVARWLAGPARNSVSHVLLISDGDLEADDFQKSLTILKAGKFHLHTLGVGTPQGNFVPLDDKETAWLKDANGNTVISHLNDSYLSQLAMAGQGIYRHADYRSDDTDAILGEVKRSLGSEDKDKALQKLWHERFYLLVGVMVVLILPSFRRPRVVVPAVKVIK